MIAAHFENLLFLLLIAVAFLFQLLARAASKASKDQRSRTQAPSKTAPPIRRAPTESDGERIRKLLEALGQPATSRPPPPVAPRTDIPPRPLAPVQPPIAQVWKQIRDERRKRDVIRRESPPPERAKRAEKILPPAMTAASAFEVHEGPLAVEQPPVIKAPVEAYAAATRPVAKGEESKIDIAILLASTSGLRNAIILREIFGPPRGLRALELGT